MTPFDIRYVSLAVFTLLALGPAATVAQQASPFLTDIVSQADGEVFRGSFAPDGSAFYYFQKVTEGEEDYRVYRASLEDEISWLPRATLSDVDFILVTISRSIDIILFMASASKPTSFFWLNKVSCLTAIESATRVR